MMDHAVIKIPYKLDKLDSPLLSIVSQSPDERLVLLK